MKHVLRYLKGTRDWKLVYGGAEGRGLEGFTDADGAMQEHRRAISGYIIVIDGVAVLPSVSATSDSVATYHI